MIRKFQNFLFGRLSGVVTEFYNGTGQFSVPPVPPKPVYSVGINVDGSGAALTTGTKGYRSIDITGTITKNRLLADQSGSIVMDVWKTTFAGALPVNANSITAAAKPTISAAVKSEDSTLTGWTTAVTAGDVLGFEIESATTITRITLELTIQPS